MQPTRPVLRYHGGKWRLAPWIIAHFPPHHVYVEPFGGAASVLVRKSRSYAEIYNDLDDQVVNLFRVLRAPEQAEALRHALELTPYARREFELAYQPATCAVEAARRLVIRSYMGHGSSGVRAHKTGFRANPYREGCTAADDWKGFPAALPALTERLRGVIIEHRPAAQVIASHNRPDVLFYLDPPYMFSTRSQKRLRGDLYHSYRHELRDDDHALLLDQLASLQSMVALSGYPNELYGQRLKGWRRVETEAVADRAGRRLEILWLNPALVAALSDGPLFSIVEAA